MIQTTEAPKASAYNPNLQARPNLPASVCALCGQKQTLRESHIIPNFVQNRIRDAVEGATFRGVENVNRRVQQMLVMPLLCDTCEKKLGRDERYVADVIDKPFREGKLTPVTVSPEVIRFMVGLAVKILSTDRADGRGHGPTAMSHITWAKAQLRDFLNGIEEHPVGIEHHLYFPFKYIGPRRGVNTMLRANVGIAISERPSDLFTVALLGGYVAVTSLRMNSLSRGGWEGGTRLVLGEDLLISGQSVTSIEFDTLIDDMATTDRLQNAKMSVAQREKIRSDFAKVEESLKTSRIWQAIQDDRENRKQFGPDDGDI